MVYQMPPSLPAPPAQISAQAPTASQGLDLSQLQGLPSQGGGQGQTLDLSALLGGLPPQQGGNPSAMPNTPNQAPPSPTGDLFNPPAAAAGNTFDPNLLSGLFPATGASNPLAPPNPFGAPAAPPQQAQAFSPYAAYSATAQAAPTMYDPNAGLPSGANGAQMPTTLVNQMAQAPTA
jgi:hypothetical protein